MFTHERFKAYQLAKDFVTIALQLGEELPYGHSGLKDQLKRAAFSIPLNIAEGTGKSGRSDRLRFYAIARGSAMECAAICDLIGLLDQKFQGRVEAAKQKLRAVVSILTVVSRKGLERDND